jgi:hypothetical protein
MFSLVSLLSALSVVVVVNGVTCGEVQITACREHIFEASFKMPEGASTTSAVQQVFDITGKDTPKTVAWTGAIDDVCQDAKDGFFKCNAKSDDSIGCPTNGVSVNKPAGSVVKFFAVVKPPAGATDCAGKASLSLDKLGDSEGQCVTPLKEIPSSSCTASSGSGSDSGERFVCTEAQKVQSIECIGGLFGKCGLGLLGADSKQQCECVGLSAECAKKAGCISKTPTQADVDACLQKCPGLAACRADSASTLAVSLAVALLSSVALAF